MKRLICVLAVAASVFASTGTALAQGEGDGSVTHGGGITVGVTVVAPGSGTPGHAGSGSGRPLIDYLISWSVDPTAAQTGSLNGICGATNAAGAVVPGFQFHLIGRDAAGNVVDDRFECVALVDLDATGRPTLAALPAVPTFAEAWNSVHIPAPSVVLDPASRGITGLDTRISTAGPASLTIAASIRGYTITGTATLDHYAISVDGRSATNAAQGHVTFETKGTHTVAISAIWHGIATLTGPDFPAGLPALDIGEATVTSTRTYPVNEIRSVLQP